MLECDFIACLWVHCKAKGEDGWGGGGGEDEGKEKEKEKKEYFIHFVKVFCDHWSILLA